MQDFSNNPSASFPDYTRTYSDIAEINRVLLNNSTHDTFNNEYKSLISVFYLIGDFYGEGVVTSNDLSTFYANEYLSNAITIQRLPSVERLSRLLQLLDDGTFCLNDEYFIDLLSSANRSSKVPTLRPYTPLIPVGNDHEQNRVHESGAFSSNLNQLTTAKAKIARHLALILKLYTFIARTRDSFDSELPEKFIYKSIKDNGYAIKQNFLSNNRLSELRTITKKIAQRERESGNAYLYGAGYINQRIYNLISKDKIYRDLLESRYFHSLLGNVFYRPTFHDKYGLSSLAAHIIPPGGKGTPLHIDSVVPESSRYRESALIPSWMIRFIIIVTLSDFVADNGSTAVIPSSHKLCRRPTNEDAGDVNEVLLTAPAGSLIMWDGLLWHRSTTNQSTTSRDALICSFAASFFKEICGEEEHLVVVPPSLQESMSPRLRQLIGAGRGIKQGATYMCKDN
jgi:hypothetical protein